MRARRVMMPPSNAPRLSCAARAGGRTDMMSGAQLYVGAQMEFCQGRAAQLQPLVRRPATSEIVDECAGSPLENLPHHTAVVPLCPTRSR